ncbi:MAG: NADH-quinone oxidoreductase subunit NuoE [Coxiellaceae bacterium]|jgi:NADH:ubiquinone oxidoreductase subunit E|nr:NADH-quinone oxidoreductase subunit NuoE [Coxiellaceae bacterium]
MNNKLNKKFCSNNCKNQEKEWLENITKILPENILQFIDKCSKEEKPHSQLIAVLHKVQDHFGYLSPEVMDAVAYSMQIPAAKVSGVASFYHYFRLKPCGKHVISVCLGTACYVKGAETVLNKFSEDLGIKEGETTKDGLFSLEVSRCLGACALAPVVKIGENIYSQMTPDKAPLIIKNCLTAPQ